MESMRVFYAKNFLACCGSCKFAQEMVLSGPFFNYQQAIDAARDILFTKVDVNGWLEAFAATAKIGESHSQKSKSSASAHWRKGEQSTALATATDSSLQRRYHNRPIVEFEIAAQEQTKITELRLRKLF